MSLPFDITRARPGRASDIDEQAWRRFVEESADFAWHPGNAAVAVWRGDGASWLQWSAGELTTASPSEAFVRRMIELAPRFGARVRGPHGEFYRSVGDAYFEEDGAEVPWAVHERERQLRVAKLRQRRTMVGTLKFVALALVVLLLWLEWRARQ